MENTRDAYKSMVNKLLENAHLDDQEDGWIILSAVNFQKQALESPGSPNNVRGILPLTKIVLCCRFDEGQDGYLDLVELKRMMEKLQAPQTHLGLKAMIKEVDEDGDSKISFREVRQTSHHYL